jgi:hypothetical protein
MTLFLTDFDLSANDESFDYRFKGNPACPACDLPIQCYGAVIDRTAVVHEKRNGDIVAICDCGFEMEVRQ